MGFTNGSLAFPLSIPIWLLTCQTETIARPPQHVVAPGKALPLFSSIAIEGRCGKYCCTHLLSEPFWAAIVTVLPSLPGMALTAIGSAAYTVQCSACHTYQAASLQLHSCQLHSAGSIHSKVITSVHCHTQDPAFVFRLLNSKPPSLFFCLFVHKWDCRGMVSGGRMGAQS